MTRAPRRTVAMARALGLPLAILTAVAAGAVPMGHEPEVEPSGERIARRQQADESTGEESSPPRTRLVVKVRGAGVGALAGATVEVEGAGRQRELSDAQGRATFAGLERGREISMVVTAEGWQAGSESLSLDEEQEEVVIELSPLLSRLTVEVEGVDADGKRVAVTACTLTVSRRGKVLATRTVASECGGVFEEVTQGRVKILVVATGWATGVAQQTLGDEPLEVKIELEKQ